MSFLYALGWVGPMAAERRTFLLMLLVCMGISGGYYREKSLTTRNKGENFLLRLYDSRPRLHHRPWRPVIRIEVFPCLSRGSGWLAFKSGGSQRVSTGILKTEPTIRRFHRALVVEIHT